MPSIKSKFVCGFKKVLLPPIKKVCDGYVFTGVCPQGWGLCPGGQEFCPQGGSTSVHAGIPHHPGKAHPLARTPPLAMRPPLTRRVPLAKRPMLRDTVNKRAVCILLECNLVVCIFFGCLSKRCVINHVYVNLPLPV